MKTAKEILKEIIIKECTDDYDENFSFYEDSVIKAMEEYVDQFRKPAVSTSTFMKERRGYKRKLLGTRYDGWTERTEYKWQYTWSDGTKSIKYTYR